MIDPKDILPIKQNIITTKTIKIKLINPNCLPKYSTDGSAAMDCFANIIEPIILEPNKTIAIPLGFAVDLDKNWVIDLKPRSGLALKSQITLENSPGLIDEDFTNELAAIVRNDNSESFTIEPLMKICQCETRHITRISWVTVDNIDSTNKSEHLGFGSTGV